MSEAFAFMGHEFGRRNERKPYDREILFSHANDMYRGIIDNISLGGARIETGHANKLSMGDMVTVCIPFTSGDKNVKRKGRIVRLDSKGFAIEFLSG